MSPEDGRRPTQNETQNITKTTEQQQRKSIVHGQSSSSTSTLERPAPEISDPKPISEIEIVTSKPPMYRLDRTLMDNYDNNNSSSESETGSGSDEMTDISPMQTPHYRNKPQINNNNNNGTFELNSMMNVLLESRNENGTNEKKYQLKTK
ncbi:unnamed protein product [Didymodactylos carnosus]|uniref:Uncharacterized protein n=1 Tax=Didymodactylos carnosus TaxID=1234261 RepID=A0A814J995_9BILA|nr:unnamed protein product [Didymodactylos carnosus]CAF1560561.1 unnamed protein product [Didymodactylos carnosus]CAF3805769.1 unnamed protein product [Didymodactylos carnosus]CAF4352148.1 unnamed protein product [Didymodactylos carnosus]